MDRAETPAKPRGIVTAHTPVKPRGIVTEAIDVKRFLPVDFHLEIVLHGIRHGASPALGARDGAAVSFAIRVVGRQFVAPLAVSDATKKIRPAVRDDPLCDAGARSVSGRARFSSTI